MKITLIGATGLVGSAVLKELDERGDTVTAITRHAENIPAGENITAKSVDVRDTAALAEALHGTHAIISAYNPGWTNPNYREDFFVATRSIIAAAKQARVNREHVEPSGEVERILAQLWAEVLGVARVGRHDGFFELGGHSLLAVKLLEQMRRHGLRASVSALFLAPTLAEFAANVEEIIEVVL